MAFTRAEFGWILLAFLFQEFEMSVSRWTKDNTEQSTGNIRLWNIEKDYEDASFASNNYIKYIVRAFVPS